MTEGRFPYKAMRLPYLVMMITSVTMIISIFGNDDHYHKRQVWSFTYCRITTTYTREIPTYDQWSVGITSTHYIHHAGSRLYNYTPVWKLRCILRRNCYVMLYDT